MTQTPLDTTAIEVRVDGPVGRMTLARPTKRNALNRAALQELAAAAAWFDDHPEVKVVVLSGQGSAFSGGFDLSDPSWSDLRPEEGSAVVGRGMAEAIGDMGALTIASVRGHCVGGGVVLAAACDLRIAAEGTQFRIPEVELGVPLYWTGVPRLVRELGPALTKELVLTGRVFDATEARSIRFVNRVVAADALEAETDAWAAELAAKPGLVLRTTKEQVDSAAPPVPADDPGVEDDIAGFAAAFADPECRTIAAEYLQTRSQRT